MPDRLTTPQWTPGPRELDDLDLLVNDSFEPSLAGFVDPRTAGDAAPITLVVDDQTADLATGAGFLELIDPEGAPLALLTVEAHYRTEDGRVGLAGPVRRLAHNEFGAFRSLHVAPQVLHKESDPATLLAVPVRRPPTTNDLAAIRQAASDDDLTPLLLACVGDRMPDRISGPALVRSCLAAAELLDDAQVVAVSTPDHGDEGRHGDWESPNDWLLASVSAAYADTALLLPRHDEGEWPESIAGILDVARPPRDRQGAVLFFTGLSGSGKSTLARALVDHILEEGERTITSLDGDVVRHHLSKGLGFSREDRETNIRRIGFVASEIARHGGLAICSPIAPFDSTRQAVRAMVERAGGGFVLIHVATPLEECERRDRKGLYAKARRGEIADFTGISSPYEEPIDAYKIDTTNRDIAECLEELLAYLVAEGWLHH
ncbi:MAG: adenylyl-sulfate kinase [Nocardioidaceae bacterium]